MDAERLKEVAVPVLRIEGEAVAALVDLDGRFARAVELLHACRGRVVLLAEQLETSFQSVDDLRAFTKVRGRSCKIH